MEEISKKVQEAQRDDSCKSGPHDCNEVNVVKD